MWYNKYMNTIFSYFQKGFFLANHSFDILLISFLFVLPLNLIPLMPSIQAFIVILYILLVFIYLGFSLSIPLFLESKQEQKKLDFKEVLFISLVNTKRIILPTILLFLLLVISILSFAFILQTSNLTTFFSNLNNPSNFHPLWLFLSVFTSLLVFTPFFFALEKRGLLQSLVKSCKVVVRNFPYVLIIFVIEYVWSFALRSIPSEVILGQLLQTIVSEYIALVTVASSLFYYQKIINKKE